MVIKRYFTKSINLLIMAISLIGILTVSYIILDKHRYRIDLTEEKRFTLSGQTIKILKKLNKEVNVIGFFKEGSPEKNMVEDLLREYVYRSRYIKLKMVDPDREPIIAKKYNIREYDTTVFECGRNRKDVERDEVFEIQQVGYYSTKLLFKGEQAFTSAILKVTQEETKKIYWLIGHGERSYNDTTREGCSQIKGYLERENYKIEELNLLITHRIPPDCHILVIAAPRGSLFKEEIEVIKEYLNKKGAALLILLDPGEDYEINNLLKEFKIKFLEGIVVDPTRGYFFDPFSIIPQYSYHEITKELIRTHMGCILPEVRGIEVNEEAKGVSPLLICSDKGWLETNLSKEIKYDEGEDKKGPVNLSVAMEEKDTRIATIGDSDFISNRLINSKGNVDFFLNVINWLSKEEEKISIRAKEPEFRRITLTGPQSRVILYLSVFFTPGMILTIGIFIYLRRRYL